MTCRSHSMRTEIFNFHSEPRAPGACFLDEVHFRAPAKVVEP